ncbi:MAG: YedE-related selenium metabolism membrane protein [Deltaproteobacteria bacterium]|nr:YedE-related selenium metabolism membrane protein [Deltaproteobacteria bacterium]
MSALTPFFASRRGIVFAGIFIGVFAPILQKLGNPANMGICVACMERDIAGALGLHRADVVQYLRPEIMGFVLGSLAAALMFKEFKARTGSAPIIRFFLGFFAMVGALVFLGCPWRALLRLAGGDGNAILGLAGLALGIWIGVLFMRGGYSLGRSSPAGSATGWVMAVLMMVLLLLAIFKPQFTPGGPIFISVKGPGAARAPLAIALIVGLGVGFLAQRTRFCTMGAIRDVILMKDFHLLSGILALVIAAFATNLILGQFKTGFVNQPIAHDHHLWNFLGMTLAGLAFTLAGGCPGRQLILSGEGDGDAAIFVLGMIVGAGFAHNFALASSPKGPGAFGPAAVVIGLIFCIAIGWAMRERSKI